jgi:hypothetical protein
MHANKSQPIFYSDILHVVFIMEENYYDSGFCKNSQFFASFSPEQIKRAPERGNKSLYNAWNCKSATKIRVFIF